MRTSHVLPTPVFPPGMQLNSMLVLCVNSHAGQFDKGGQPYILHTLRVMNNLATTDEELQCIALGHDVVEDCGVTYAQLAHLHFTPRIIEGIRCLTKTTGESYEEYKTKVFGNWDAVRVKLEDVRDNSDIRRLKGVTEKDIQRMIRYQNLYLELKAHVENRVEPVPVALDVIARLLRVHENRGEADAYLRAQQLLANAHQETTESA